MWRRVVGTLMMPGLLGNKAVVHADERSEIRELRKTVERLRERLEELERAVGAPPAREKELGAEVERLEREVQELRARAVPVEPAEEIKRVTQWMCERGHLFASAPEGERCPFDGTRVSAREEYRKVKLQRRERISEILDARLDEEARRRVALAVSATAIVQQTAGSGPDRTRGVRSADLLLVARPALETMFFVDAEAIGGEGPDALVGSASGLNADAGSLQDEDGADRVTIREAWLSSRFLARHRGAVARKIDLTNYFDRNDVANDETRQFLSGMFVNNPLLGRPVEGVGHEANAPGVQLSWDTFREFRFAVGAQAPEDSGGALGRTPFAIGEVGFATQRFGGPGNYRLWFRRNAGADRTRALGVSLDQAVGAKLRGFGRHGFQFGGGGRERHAWSLGLGLRSPLVLRPRDDTGLAYGWVRAENGRVEDLAELYHRVCLTDHLSVSPRRPVRLRPRGRRGNQAARKRLPRRPPHASGLLSPS